MRGLYSSFFCSCPPPSSVFLQDRTVNISGVVANDTNLFLPQSCSLSCDSVSPGLVYTLQATETSSRHGNLESCGPGGQLWRPGWRSNCDNSAPNTLRFLVAILALPFFNTPLARQRHSLSILFPHISCKLLADCRCDCYAAGWSSHRTLTLTRPCDRPGDRLSGQGDLCVDRHHLRNGTSSTSRFVPTP